MKQKQKKKVAISELPSMDRGRIEVVCKRKNEELLVTGVLRILAYGSEKMCFEIKSGRLTVEGDGLDCVIYTNGAIGLVGKVHSLVLTHREEQE